MSTAELSQEPTPTDPADDSPSRDLPRLGASAEAGGRVRGPIRPINWNLLTSDQAEVEWLELNSWVSWLKLSYGLTPSVLPPLWHRHPELVWELSALHCHWLGAYDPEQHASGPITWHRDFAEARTRLREWVQACGTRVDRDRPTRQTTWPGDAPYPSGDEAPIIDRDADFVEFVKADIASRRAEEDAYFRLIAEEEVRKAQTAV